MAKFTGIARCSREYSQEITVEAATKEEARELILAEVEKDDTDEWASDASPIDVDLDEVSEDE